MRMRKKIRMVAMELTIRYHIWMLDLVGVVKLSISIYWLRMGVMRIVSALLLLFRGKITRMLGWMSVEILVLVGQIRGDG